MKIKNSLNIAAFLYTALIAVYVFYAQKSDFWASFYFIREDLFIVFSCLFMRRFSKIKSLFDVIIIAKTYSIISLLFYTSSEVFFLEKYSNIFMILLIINSILCRKKDQNK
jgi:hypothetical protein